MGKQKLFIKNKFSDDTPFNHVSQFDNEEIKQVSCYNNNCFVLLANGNVYATGKNKVCKTGKLVIW